MLDIQTFDARSGGNVIYKALAHPLAAERAQALFEQLRTRGPIAVFDPDHLASALFAMHPRAPEISAIFVQSVTEIGSNTPAYPHARSPSSPMPLNPRC